jgi:gamma-glutamylputrescine oxidase
LDRLRKIKTTPVLMLTARDAIGDRIRGLDLGADDYLPKPFDMDELMARVRSLIRRSNAAVSPSFEIGKIRVDTSASRVYMEEQEVVLTGKEYALVQKLCLNRGKVVGTQNLLEAILDEEDDSMSNLLNVHLFNIRKKLGKDFHKSLYEMVWRGHDIIHERVEKYGIDCDLKNGFIQVATKKRHLQNLESQNHYMDLYQDQYEHRILDREETRQALGTDFYLSGLLSQRNGHLHPLNLCIGEARAAHELGAKIFENSPVTNITHGTRPRVETEEGHVEADTVVLAGNAYHLLERQHLSGLTFPAGSYIIGTEPLSEELRQEINPMDLAVCDSSEVVDYYRLSADGRMLYGGRCNYSGRDPKSIQASIRPRMLEIYPQLKDVKIEFEWGGKIGIVINRMPVIGRINGNVYYAQGYSGHGVNATHIMGEVVADAISGTMEKFDLFEKTRHYRLPGGQWFGNQLVALGMIYYRLMDMR